MKPALALALAASLVAVSARPAFARPAFAQDPAPQESSEGEASKSKSEDAKESKEEHWLAVVGGEVHTGTGAVLRGATVLAKNGKIEKIGYDLDVPPDAKTIFAPLRESSIGRFRSRIVPGCSVRTGSTTTRHFLSPMPSTSRS